jgi:hypothetical protein
MTPRQHRAYAKAEEGYQKQIAQEKYEKWHIRLGRRITLGEARDSMKSFALAQEDVPLIIKLVENPKYDIGLFAGYVDLFAHDCIHILLGRGLLVKDEAFVIGYTMGSSQKMFRWRRNLFMFCAKYFYPEGYRFGEDERFVFNVGVMAGSKCKADLSKVDFSKLLSCELEEARRLLGVSEAELRGCYSVEKGLFKKSAESRRLI